MRESTKSKSQPVRRRKIYEDVSKQIRHEILKKLKPGDKLPPIRKLAAMLGVTPSSVRQAIRGLELLGVVNPWSGAGTVVRYSSADRFVNPVSNFLTHQRKLLGELLDFRKMLEPTLAAFAAEHATPKDIGKMEEILRRQEDKISQGDIALEEGAEFHFAIATVSENTIAVNVLQILMELLLELRERSLQVKGCTRKSLAGHRRIVAAIEQRNPAAARSAMRRHIQDIEEIVLKELGKKKVRLRPAHRAT